MKPILPFLLILLSNFLIVGCESEVPVEDDPAVSEEFQQDYEKQMEEEMKKQGKMPGN